MSVRPESPRGLLARCRAQGQLLGIIAAPPPGVEEEGGGEGDLLDLTAGPSEVEALEEFLGAGDAAAGAEPLFMPRDRCGAHTTAHLYFRNRLR